MPIRRDADHLSLIGAFARCGSGEQLFAALLIPFE
jgi:hypothetical protein